ncbi:aminoacyl-tRNA hydrolase [Candidatus Uhrbacteria bacterium]|nr:aminoacyl-tRNA hydrolase [Candidatus Uhrbacteria bacterium]
MHLILGLGNPEPKYVSTRHNLGFLTVDAFAKEHSFSFTSKDSMSADVAEGRINEEKVVLAKPTTHMNLSGEAVKKLVEKYRVAPDQIIVVYDDADLPFGMIRTGVNKSAGGHNGVQSIIENLPAEAPFLRVRMGIGRPTDTSIPLDVWVLSKWTDEEQKALPELIARGTQAIDALRTSPPPPSPQRGEKPN